MAEGPGGIVMSWAGPGGLIMSWQFQLATPVGLEAYFGCGEITLRHKDADLKVQGIGVFSGVASATCVQHSAGPKRDRVEI